MSFFSARKKAGLSQREAADKLGVSDVAVCHWETGKHQPKAKLLIEIAKLYNCSVDDLLRSDGGEEVTE